MFFNWIRSAVKNAVLAGVEDAARVTVHGARVTEVQV